MRDDAPFLLDVTRLIWRRWRGRQPTGIDRVSLAYLRHFGPRAQAVVQHEWFRGILHPSASQKMFALLADPGRHFKAALIGGLLRSFAQLNDKGRGRVYLNVGHTGLDSPGYAEWLQRADVRPVFFVHDLIPISHPQFCRAGEDIRHRKRMRTVLQSSHGIITNSRATLEELTAFARAEKLGIPRVTAIWLGSDPLRWISGEASPSRPTFVTVGTIEARKNHQMLLNIWSRLIDRLGHAAPQLAIAGQRGWEAESVFKQLDGDEKLRGHVVELNNCSDEDLARLFASARALLFPSLAEGFGLPLIEALDSEVPVIASDLPVFRELAGTTPLYLNPSDERAWEDAIIQYAEPESGARAAQKTRLRAFERPTWESHFAAVERWLGTLP